MKASLSRSIRFIPLLLTAAVLLPPAARAKLIVVTTANDVDDGDTSSIAALQADPGPDGKISLREAIHAANDTPGTHDIRFVLDGSTVGTIQLKFSLPEITTPVRINGTCFGKPCIEIRAAFSFNEGLVITTGQSVVEGLLLNGFQNGLVLRGGGNIVKRCYIGVDFDGKTRRSNAGGILIESENNKIGTGVPGEGNVISGGSPRAAAISIIGNNATGNQVKGNFIGTDFSGTQQAHNDLGIYIQGASNNTIGGNTPADRNVISGNTGDGVHIRDGVNNQVLGNYIGTDADGTKELSNLNGVIIRDSGSSGNIIGGMFGGARNVISGNRKSGVVIFFGTDNQVLGNYIGTDATGKMALPNNEQGVLIEHGSDNVIGGNTPGARNVISGNGDNGVSIFSHRDNSILARNTRVLGNRIGTDADGNGALANGGDGIYVLSSPASTITGNVIAGNTKAGIVIQNSTVTSVLGNYIGTTPQYINLGNGAAGVRLLRAPGSELGQNTIGFNETGVQIDFSDRNALRNNFIGLSRSGVPIGNKGDGVCIDESLQNTIGGQDDRMGNTIAHNGGVGIDVGGHWKNAFLRNSIHSNERLGIDLRGNGVTPNDAGDEDIGPNFLQNFPVLSEATATSGGLFVQGFLSSKPNTVYRLEFFASAQQDLSGHGEGQRYLGTLDVTTASLGVAQFTFTSPGVAGGQVVTSTATDPEGNTSEFSAAVEVIDPTPSETLTYKDKGNQDMTDPNNYIEGKSPTPNDTVNISAGNAGVVPADNTLNVQELNVTGAGGAETTVQISGEFFSAQTINQSGNTTVVVSGGATVEVGEWNNNGGTTSSADGATIQPAVTGGTYNATGAKLTVDGIGVRIITEVTVTNTTISGTQGSELTLAGSNTFNTGTKLVNTDPDFDPFTITFSGDTDLAGNTDLDRGVILANQARFTISGNLRGGSDEFGLLVNDDTGIITVENSRIIDPHVENKGTIEVPAGSSLTQNGGGIYDPGSTFILDGLVNFFGSEADYEIWQANFIGDGHLNLRASLLAEGGSSIDQNLTITIVSDYTMPAGAELIAEVLDDSGPGTGHDVLHVEGDLTLGGTLRVVPLGSPPPGEYAIVTFTGALSGGFEATNLPAGAKLLFPGDAGGEPGMVKYVLSPPVPFSDWIIGKGVPVGKRDALDDAAGDGVSNLFAYLYRIDPLKGRDAGDAHALPVGFFETIDERQYLTFIYRHNRESTGLTVELQVSETHKADGWLGVEQSAAEQIGIDPITADPLIQYRIDVTGFDRMFLRLRVRAH